MKLTVTQLKELHQFLHFLCKTFYLDGMLQNFLSAKHYQFSQNHCHIVNRNGSPSLSLSNCHCCTYLCMDVLIKQKLFHISFTLLKVFLHCSKLRHKCSEVNSNTVKRFNVLLTVHHAVILGNFQLDAQILFNVFIYL